MEAFFAKILDPQTVPLHISYAIIIVALLLKDVLWLRSVLMASQIFMIAYSIVIGNPLITIYNTVFFTINSVQVIRLLLERRPVTMPDELLEIYHKVFSVMGMREFLAFWNGGEIINITEGTPLCEEGNVPEALMLIVNGKVSVQKNGKEIVQLGRGAFIAEMSFMTDEPASADVKAVGKVEYISWDRDRIQDLKQANPDLMIKVQVILGKDLTAKLKSKA